eukprot:9067003-Alexandrium_andersonii.AAC.1
MARRRIRVTKARANTLTHTFMGRLPAFRPEPSTGRRLIVMVRTPHHATPRLRMVEVSPAKTHRPPGLPSLPPTRGRAVPQRSPAGY